MRPCSGPPRVRAQERSATHRGRAKCSTRSHKQNVAGKFDYYTLVMSWSPTHCVTAQEGRDEQQCARLDGLRYGFVLHGLWPQYEKGYPEACRIGRKPFVPQPVINSMLDIMPSGGLVIHEYKLHGTCSGLEPADYYKLSRQLFTRVRVPERFKNPFETQFIAPREAGGRVHARQSLAAPRYDRRQLRRARQPAARRAHLPDARRQAPRACGQNENQRKLCRADADACAARALDAARGRSREREGASNNPLQPKRDRGLPRPRVLEARAAFEGRARPCESGAQTIGDKLWTSARAPRLRHAAALPAAQPLRRLALVIHAECGDRRYARSGNGRPRPTLRPAPSASSAPTPPRRAAARRGAVGHHSGSSAGPSSGMPSASGPS